MPTQAGTIVALRTGFGFGEGDVGYGIYLPDGQVKITWPSGRVTTTAWPSTDWYGGTPAEALQISSYDSDAWKL